MLLKIIPVAIKPPGIGGFIFLSSLLKSIAISKCFKAQSLLVALIDSQILTKCLHCSQVSIDKCHRYFLLILNGSSPHVEVALLYQSNKIKTKIWQQHGK
jgi:hypothetical protein